MCETCEYAPPDPEVDGTREERGEHLWREARVPVAGVRCEHAAARRRGRGRGAVLSSMRSTCTRRCSWWCWHVLARGNESLAAPLSSAPADCSGAWALEQLDVGALDVALSLHVASGSARALAVPRGAAGVALGKQVQVRAELGPELRVVEVREAAQHQRAERRRRPHRHCRSHEYRGARVAL